MSERVIAWFSCGAASAVAAKLAIEKYGHDRVCVAYCDLTLDEDPDNVRFRSDVARWLDHPIEMLASTRYRSIEDVFAARRYMSGPKGAPCTVEMKKLPRFAFQEPDDVHVFGLTADEGERIDRFTADNHELRLDWVLRDADLSKDVCLQMIMRAGIKLPALYLAGFTNNNCIGCVKATSPKYWNRVREYRPDVFARRASQSREIGCRLVRFKGERIFLDELPRGNYSALPDEHISCGPECRGESDDFVLVA